MRHRQSPLRTHFASRFSISLAAAAMLGACNAQSELPPVEATKPSEDARILNATNMMSDGTPVLPHIVGLQVWKLLKESAKRARQESSVACPECGMTLAEFRSKGRLGCPHDYEVFAAHLKPLLLRVHNAAQHRGRLPGQDEGTRRRRQRLSDLRSKLEAAIREEAYESAAQLRDEIQELEAPPKGS